jgi:hypothetical protein
VPSEEEDTGSISRLDLEKQKPTNGAMPGGVEERHEQVNLDPVYTVWQL